MSGLEKFIGDITSTMKERVKNPIVFSYGVSWIAVNHVSIIKLFQGADIDNVSFSYWLPIVFAAVYLLGAPHLVYWLAKATRSVNKNTKNEKIDELIAEQEKRKSLVTKEVDNELERDRRAAEVQLGIAQDKERKKRAELNLQEADSLTELRKVLENEREDIITREDELKSIRGDLINAMQILYPEIKHTELGGKLTDLLHVTSDSKDLSLLTQELEREERRRDELVKHFEKRISGNPMMSHEAAKIFNKKKSDKEFNPFTDKLDEIPPRGKPQAD